MAIDLSLTADCVAPLGIYLTDQEPTPEEVEALLEFRVENLSTDLPDKVLQVLDNKQRPGLVTQSRTVFQRSQELDEPTRYPLDLYIQKEATIVEISLMNQLLQIATQAASEAQSPSMQRFCHTMQTNLQIRIDHLTERYIELEEEAQCYRRHITDAAASGTLTPQEATALTNLLEAEPSVYRAHVIEDPGCVLECTSKPIKSIDQLTHEEIAYLRQSKDSILLMALLSNESNVIFTLLNKIAIPYLQSTATDRGRKCAQSYREAYNHRLVQMTPHIVEQIESVLPMFNRVEPIVVERSKILHES